METKLIEVRDRATCMSVMATKISGKDGPVARRAGYGSIECVILTRLDNGEGRNDPFEWPPITRTLRMAHLHIREHFHGLRDGSVVDVEYILGETDRPKDPECW